MIRHGSVLAIALTAFACGSTIDVGQSNNADGGMTGNDGGASGSDAGPQLTPGTASVTGTVNGESFVVKDAVGEVNNDGSSFHELWVSITDRADVCSLVQAGAESSANTKGIRLGLSSGSLPPLTIGPGTYVIGDTSTKKPAFAAFFLNTDATCTAGVGRVDATAGTITVSDITAGAINGTFELTFPSGSLKGSFGATVCDARSATGGVKCAP